MARQSTYDWVHVYVNGNGPGKAIFLMEVLLFLRFFPYISQLACGTPCFYFLSYILSIVAVMLTDMLAHMKVNAFVLYGCFFIKIHFVLAA